MYFSCDYEKVNNFGVPELKFKKKKIKQETSEKNGKY